MNILLALLFVCGLVLVGSDGELFPITNIIGLIILGILAFIARRKGDI